MSIYGVSGYQNGTATSFNGNKMPKKERTSKVMVGSVGASIRPTSGQILPRGA